MAVDDLAAGLTPAPGRALRLAHRGDWRRAPENSLAAMLAALEIPGCDGIEFDVRASRDGVAVLHHDRTLARRHGVRFRCADLTADQLAEYGIPALEAVLATVPRRAYIDVDLKDDPGRGAFEALVAGRGPGLERAVVSSFTTATLERVAGWAPSWPRWLNAHQLTDQTVSKAVGLGCDAVSVDFRAIDEHSIGRAIDAGLDVVAWTVRRRSTLRRLERLGVSAVCVEAAALDD